MNKVYLVNLGFRLAGVERRFANIWRALRARGRVEPVLVIPDVLARNLREAHLLPPDSDGVIEVPVPRGMAGLVNRQVFRFGEVPRAVLQSRVVALGYRPFWKRVVDEPGAVLHFGMPCAALTPPDVPSVYECMDATLGSFRNSHYRRASKRAVIVHCQTDRIRRGLQDAYAAEATRWRLVFGQRYFADYQVPPAIERHADQIAFVGRFTAIKSPLLFIESLARVAQSGVRCHAVMLGEGPMRQEIDAAINRFGLHDRVQIRFSTRPLEVLAASAVYVSLQTGDNFGSQALLEAMGAGCAIIATDVGETRRLVTPEVGTTVPHDVDALAAALIDAVSHPERTRARGTAAATLALTEYTADAYAASLEQLYAQAAALHGGAQPVTPLEGTEC